MLLTDVQPYDSDVVTSVHFNLNLLVAPTFVKRRKLICTPDIYIYINIYTLIYQLEYNFYFQKVLLI